MSKGKDSYFCQTDPDADPEGPKKYESYGSEFQKTASQLTSSKLGNFMVPSLVWITTSSTVTSKDNKKNLHMHPEKIDHRDGKTERKLRVSSGFY